MTERLAALLHEEAETVAVPPLPATAVVRRGRGLRVRRRVRLGGTVLGVAAVVAVTVAGTRLDGDQRPSGRDLAAAVPATDADWAVAQGSTVHVGTGATADLPGQVKALYYTSAGMLARIGTSSATDAPDSAYWLVDSDGSSSDFDLHLGDRVPGTDPTLPYLAYATAGDDAAHWTVVLRDVRTGEVAARIPIEGAFTWGGWVAPPVALSGDHVYVGVDGTLLDVRWRTGEVRTTTIPTHLPETAGGRDIVFRQADKVVDIIETATGAVVRSLPYDPEHSDDPWPRFSPDGSHVLLPPTGVCSADTGQCRYDDPETVVIDLATGSRTTFELAYGGYGWTATGRLLLVDGTTVRSCDPDTRACTTTPVTLTDDTGLKVSGNSYES
ncbi:hypothetical protein [Nocardioides nitrophenolicus]|uniref:hypothetical protein n=1 Tax=Nocardioides nitrophenolicus TaxID=60489 RepID=UPI00195A6807|nr:hypothetical protein [Nocardioides nitrophenolicus]MBM7519409.1 hypothetical protein [Nocardioides nitrophenolicus]